MSRIKLIVGVVLACGYAVPCHASEWWVVTVSGNSPDRRVFFMDTESVTTEGAGKLKVWSFQINERLDQSGKRKVKYLEKFDCSNRTTTLLAATTYGNNDRLIDSFVWEYYEQKPKDIVPDTIGDDQWKFVCKNSSSDAFKIDNTPEETAAAIFRSR